MPKLTPEERARRRAIGAHVARLREQAGIGPKAMAGRVKIPRTTWQAIEQGYGPPHEHILARAADVLGLPLAAMYPTSYKPEPPREPEPDPEPQRDTWLDRERRASLRRQRAKRDPRLRGRSPNVQQRFGQ